MQADYYSRNSCDPCSFTPCFGTKNTLCTFWARMNPMTKQIVLFSKRVSLRMQKPSSFTTKQFVLFRQVPFPWFLNQCICPVRSHYFHPVQPVEPFKELNKSIQIKQILLLTPPLATLHPSPTMGGECHADCWGLLRTISRTGWFNEHGSDGFSRLLFLRTHWTLRTISRTGWLLFV